MTLEIIRLADGRYRATMGPIEVIRLENGGRVRVSASELSCAEPTRAAALEKLRELFEVMIVRPLFGALPESEALHVLKCPQYIQGPYIGNQGKTE